MKYAKILGLLAISAAALMAFAGVASATVVTAPAGSTYTGEIKAENEGGHVVLDNPIAKIECTSNVAGTITQHGAGVTVKGNITSLSFTNCTNSWHVTVISAGTLEAHALGGGNATLTSSGATVEATRFGIACRYSTTNTDIGTLTGAATSTSHATLDISAAIPFHGGSGLCGGGATTWTGSYKVTTPTGASVS
jgi:hypothetical protein